MQLCTQIRLNKCNFEQKYDGMERKLMQALLEWRDSATRKPLIIQGARQVGKTWLMKEFGSRCFKQVVYINFESSKLLRTMFELDYNIKRIIGILEIESGITIVASNTIILLDEIQEAAGGLTALKYFYENNPEYFVIAAGSLLGISIQNGTTFPVGKVDFLTLHPLNFEEFLISMNESNFVNHINQRNWDVLNLFHDKLIQLLRTYYYVGGMPEVVSNFITHKNFKQVREIQEAILKGYENDFSKYAPIEIVPKIRLVWNSILGQLAKENKKFIYGQLNRGARAKEFESAISWLEHAGLIHKCIRINKPELPLKSHANIDIFKIFILDIGLLLTMSNLSEQILLNKNQILIEFKGALSEQYVLQELINKYETFYWSAEQANAELDFIIQQEHKIIPIEVKAEENLKSKSLKVFSKKYEPEQSIRCSMSKYRNQDWMINIPLYAVGTV